MVGFDVSDKIEAFDIDPKHPDIQLYNYLEKYIKPEGDKYLVMGNPPFGRQGSLAKKFIKHSCSFADTIAFILPRSFKKESMYRCFSLLFHKIYEEDLKEDSFVYMESVYSVPCVFQIWKKLDKPRHITPKEKPKESYKFVNKEDSPSLAFRRIGLYAGKFIFSSMERLSPQSHYFIHTYSDINPYIRNKMLSFSWKTDNTTGPKSISKQELIGALNSII